MPLLYQNLVNLSVTQRKDYGTKRVINLTTQCQLEAGEYWIEIYPPLEKENTESTPESTSMPHLIDGKWKEGYAELWAFFLDVMKQINSVVTSSKGIEIWNKLLSQRDTALLDQLEAEMTGNV